MGIYANRTCYECGIRKPQPEMARQEIYAEVGKSKVGVSSATWLGLAVGDKKSTNSINRWLFNSGQRTYKRKKTVFLCRSCAGKEVNAANAKNVFYLLLVIFFIGLVIFTG